MSEPKMSAEERVRALPGVGGHANLEGNFWRFTARTVIDLIEAHAAAAVAEVTRERDTLRERVRVRHREDQAWVTKQLAQVYPWWQRECQARETARADALAARRERDEHSVRAQKAEARVAELAAEVQDWRDGVARVMAEPCPSDEKHCTCVPLQRVLIAEMTRERDEALALAEIRRFNRSRVRYARSHVESVLRWDALRPSERGFLVAALAALNEALETPSDAEARIMARLDEIASKLDLRTAATP